MLPIWDVPWSHFRHNINEFAQAWAHLKALVFRIHAPSFKTAFGNPIKQQISILLKLGPVAITLATRTGQYLHEGSIFWVENLIGCLPSCLEAYHNQTNRIWTTAKVMAGCPNNSSGFKTTFPKEFWKKSFRTCCRTFSSCYRQVFRAIDGIAKVMALSDFRALTLASFLLWL